MTQIIRFKLVLRMTDVFLGVVLFFFMILPYPVSAHDAEWPGEKLEKMYPDAQSYEQRNLYISSQQRQNIEGKLGEPIQEEDLKPSLYFAVVKLTPDSKPQKAAVMIFMDAHGQEGVIEIGLRMSSKGVLEKIEIFNKDTQSDLISGPDFINQFQGKTHIQSFKVGVDITAPKGLEKSGQAIATATLRGMLIINELFSRK